MRLNALFMLPTLIVGPFVGALPDSSPSTPSESNTPTNANFHQDVLATSPLSVDFQKHSTLAGSLHPLYHSFVLSKREASLLWKTLKTTVHWQDMTLLTIAAWLTVPVVQLHYEVLPSIFYKQKAEKVAFRDTWIYQVADHFQQIAQIAMAVYMVDILKLFCMAMGIQACKMEAFPHAVCQIAYTVWLANRSTKLVRYGMRSYVSDHPETFGRMRILNRLVDAVIYALTILIALNIMKVQMGIAMQSILAFGSVGTLAVGLASQGIAREVLNGLMLASSDRLYEGDDVQFGNGVSGTIVNLGWMETVLRGSDEMLVSVPNTDLVKQRVSNLSRVRLSQVKQVLKVKVDDAESIPSLLDRIRFEIRMACPKLVTDGSRPFRVVWTGIIDDGTHEITIDTRHRIKPTSDEYWTNRQNLLAAIQRALKERKSQPALR